MISKHLLTHKYYNEKKKKPDLQLQILRELTWCKSLSKWKVREVLMRKSKDKSYPVISDAVDNLRRHRLIEQTGTKKARRLEEKFYSITDDGLCALIAEESNPENFWSCIIRVCHYRSDLIDMQTITELYELFIANNLKYASGRETVLYLDELNDFYAKWITAQRISETSPATRVLEILACYPTSTKEGLSSRLTDISDSNLNQILQDLSLPPGKENYNSSSFLKHIHQEAKKLDMSGGVYLEQRRFLQRSIINDIHSGKETYRLSIFGILLFLTILLHQKLEKSKHIKHLYDKIASNYSDLLPLIFGKWQLLNDKLGNDWVFNFDVVLSRSFRCNRSDKSVILHGYKELYQSARSIIQHNISKLRLIYETGIDSVEKYEVNKMEGITPIDRSKKKDMSKFVAIDQKLWEISVIVNYTNMQQGSSTLLIKSLTYRLAKEINLVFYLNLIARDKQYANLDRLDVYLKESDMPTTRWTSVPARQFLQILEEDKEINAWFNNWKKDIIDFQRAVNEKIVEEPMRTSGYQEFTPHWYEEEFRKS